MCDGCILGMSSLVKTDQMRPGPEVIKLFSCSAQLSWKFKALINTEIAKINQHLRFRSPNPVIYPANKC